jgi:hypothetical protein
VVGAPRLKQVAVEVSNRSSKYDVAISLQLTSHDVVHTNAGREHIDGALSVYSTDQVLQPLWLEHLLHKAAVEVSNWMSKCDFVISVELTCHDVCSYNDY